MSGRLSIVIPVYNEELRLKKNVVATIGYLERRHYDYEVVIVNDGSTDATNEIIGELMRLFKTIRLIDYAPNRGKGYAVKLGMLEGKGEYIFFIDADGSTPIETLEELLPYLQKGKADIVIGSRNMQESKREVTQPYYRRLLGKVGTYLIRRLVLPDVEDSQCGFKGFTNKAAHDIFSLTTIRRWGFDFEVLVLGQERGYQIKEVPVRWLDSTGSRLRPIRGAISTFIELLQVKRNILSGKYLKD